MEQPEIIAISEIKPKHFKTPLYLAQFNLPDYNIEEINILDDKGRGMLLYVHSSVVYNLVDIYKFEVEEAVVCELQTKEADKLYICSLYRSPSSDEGNNNNINELIKWLSNKAKNNSLIIMGDFNYPNINWELMSNKTNTIDKEFKFIETVRDSFLYQHVTDPTRGRSTDNPSLLDLVFTDDQNLITEIKHEAPLGKSDHCLLNIRIKSSKETDPNSKTRPNYNKANFETMKEDFNLDWNELFAQCPDDVDG